MLKESVPRLTTNETPYIVRTRFSNLTVWCLAQYVSHMEKRLCVSGGKCNLIPNLSFLVELTPGQLIAVTASTGPPQKY